MNEDPDDSDTVTALRFDRPESAEELAAWCGGEVARPLAEPDDLTVLVPAPGGPLPARIGDWIVLQSDGSYRPYAPEVFGARFTPST